MGNKCVYCQECKFNIPTYLGHGVYQAAHCGYQEWNEFTGQLSFECTYAENVKGGCIHYQEAIKELSIFEKIIKIFKR